MDMSLFHKFRTGEPNLSNGDCVVAGLYDGHLWNSTECDNLYYVVCQELYRKLKEVIHTFHLLQQITFIIRRIL